MSSAEDRDEKRRLATYVAPFVLYLLLTVVAGRFFPDVYPLAYSVAMLITAVVTFGLLRGQRILQPHRCVLAGVAFGLIGIALWIALSTARLEETLTAGLPSWLQPKARVGLDPFAELSSPVAVWGFIAVRLFGLVILTPIAEELFWRGFLLRWLISPDWEEVPLGRFSFSSFIIVTLLFTAAHPEWFAAAIYCALLNGLMYWKKDLWTCVVAHGVSNLALAIYILATGTWWLW